MLAKNLGLKIVNKSLLNNLSIFGKAPTSLNRGLSHTFLTPKSFEQFGAKTRFLQDIQITPVSRIIQVRSFSNGNHFNQEVVNPTPNPTPAPKEKLGFKELMKKYGLSAFIVYNLLSAIDLSLSFSLLHFGGEEWVFFLESKVKALLQYFGYGNGTITHSQGTKPSVWTTFAVAYSIHKLLVPIRVPLTAAFTPKFAKFMIQRGWMKPKLPTKP